MQQRDFYSEAHLFVAAIRIFEHQKSLAPSVEDICKMLSFSLEQAHLLCRKLQAMEIVKVVDSAFGVKLYVNDHRKIEDIPAGETGSRMADEIRKFKESKKEISHKIESIQAEQKEKKKNLFAELEKNLKKELQEK